MKNKPLPRYRLAPGSLIQPPWVPATVSLRSGGRIVWHSLGRAGKTVSLSSPSIDSVDDSLMYVDHAEERMTTLILGDLCLNTRRPC